MNLIHEDCLAVEGHVVGTDDATLLESQDPFDVSVYLKADVDGAFFDEKHFFHLFNGSGEDGA